jgi:hypothetical protein
MVCLSIKVLQGCIRAKDHLTSKVGNTHKTMGEFLPLMWYLLGYLPMKLKKKKRK